MRYALLEMFGWIAFFGGMMSASAAAEDLVRLSNRSERVAEQCYRQAGYFGWEQTKCGFAEQARQERLVNRAYDAARRRTGHKGKKTLAVSQQAWIVTVRQKCNQNAVFGPSEIGTIATVDGLMCLATERSKRIVWLERRNRPAP
jgi:uncharacterized protein YecT (DUF1311 family)